MGHHKSLLSGVNVCSDIHDTNWKKGKEPHPQDKIQHLDFTKDPRPLY